MLNNGEADLLAMGLTVTNDRAKVFEFTEPIMTTHQVLVQRKPDKYLQMATADEIESHLIRNQIDLANKEIDYTVADEHIALVNSKYYPNIDIKTPLSFPQKIAWAAKKGQTGLTDTINSWLAGRDLLIPLTPGLPVT